MIRYSVDAGAPAPLEDARCEGLAALGFHRDGAYRATGREGDVWIDDAGTTMVAVQRRGDVVKAIVHTVLEDGTHVCTEEKGPALSHLLVPVARKLPSEGLSVSFPPDVYDVKQLLAAHRSHVEATESARKTKARTGASVGAFVAARNDAEREVGAVRSLLRRVGFSLGGLGLFGGALIACLQAMNGREEQIAQWLSFGAITGLVNYVMGAMFFGPSMIAKGRISAKVERPSESRAGEVTSIHARSVWLPVLLWTAAAGAIVGAAVKGAGGLPLVLEAFAMMGLGEHAFAKMRNRKGRHGRRVGWAIADGVLRVDGERPLALSEITAAIRSEEDGPALVVLDRRQRVVLRLTGPADVLDEIHAAVSPRRSSFPIARDFRSLAALLVPLLTAVVIGFGKPELAKIFYGIAAIIVGLAPLSNLRARRTVDVGVDGLVIEGRFVAFADVTSLTTSGDRLTVVEKSGKRTSLELEHPGATDAIERRWTAHTERSDGRDETEVVRRRVAIEDEADEVPYRARIASPEELGEALLDSAEARSVRLRAAKRLARTEGEDAARIREDVEEQVIDPEVRHALDRPRE